MYPLKTCTNFLIVILSTKHYRLVVGCLNRFLTHYELGPKQRESRGRWEYVRVWWQVLPGCISCNTNTTFACLTLSANMNWAGGGQLFPWVQHASHGWIPAFFKSHDCKMKLYWRMTVPDSPVYTSTEYGVSKGQCEAHVWLLFCMLPPPSALLVLGAACNVWKGLALMAAMKGELGNVWPNKVMALLALSNPHEKNSTEEQESLWVLTGQPLSRDQICTCLRSTPPQTVSVLDPNNTSFAALPIWLPFGREGRSCFS